jgi:hypothetical protein
VGHQATLACGANNLCAGLKAGIEGAIHAVRSKWDAHLDGLCAGKDDSINSQHPSADSDTASETDSDSPESMKDSELNGDSNGTKFGYIRASLDGERGIKRYGFKNVSAQKM